MQHHIFLSYSRKDSEIMARLRDDFRAAGLTAWTDEGIEPGTPSWQRAIEAAIINAGCMVCVLSPDAYSSHWVREELNFAKLHNKYIFPVLARGDERTSLPFGFTSSQWVDIRDEEKYTSTIQNLVPNIQKKTLSAIGFEPTRITVSDVLPPPFEWCEIPAGKVRLKDMSGLGGTKGGTSTVERFYIGKYPITNAQYQVFFDDENGYSNDEWWTFSEDGVWWRKSYSFKIKFVSQINKLPRTGVSWYDSVAFCRWLSHKTHLSISLPTEAQWQRAAQGDDKRIYPWGNNFSQEKCNGNNERTGVERLTPVDQYPNGVSPFGVFDMTGNVWEWCLDVWGSRSTSLKSHGDRMARGGAWHNSQRALEVTCRSSWLLPHTG